MQSHRNLQEGDIVLLRYQAKFSRQKYRLARVTALHPDGCGRVRTVTVGLRNRAKAVGEAPEECRAGLTSLKVPVQRLVVILPWEEQGDATADQPQEEQEDEAVDQPRESREEAGLEDQEQDYPAVPPLPQRPMSARTSRWGASRSGGLQVQVPTEVPEMKDL